MENKIIKIGIAGAGAIAAVHIDSFLLFGDRCRITAICDSFPDKAKELAEKKCLNAKVFSSYEDMLDSDIDMVSICLPPDVHATMSIKAMDKHKHVICEKPMASSLEECDAMIEAARRNNVVFTSICQNRFKTPVQKVLAMLRKESAGKLLSADFKSLWWRGKNYYDIWWRGTWAQECGGCFKSHSVHYLDLMQMFLGMPSSVMATMGNVWHDNSECEDLGYALFDYNGVPVIFTSSLVNHGEEQNIHFDCEKASLNIPLQIKSFKPLSNGFPEENSKEIEKLQNEYEGLPDLKIEGHPAQLLNFLKAISGEEELKSTAQDGRKTIELIMGIYKSSASGMRTAFPIQPDDHVYTKSGLIEMMPHFHEKTRSVDNFTCSEITLGRNMGK